VPFAPAGPTDIMARILGQNLATAIGGSIITENRSGAGGNIGIGYVAHASRTATRCWSPPALCRQSRAVCQKCPTIPTRISPPIAELGTSPNVILVDPSSALLDRRMIARAKAHPDELNYASPGAGTTPHLSGEFLKIVAGIEMTHVPFSGAMPAVQALLGGVTQVAVTALPPAHP